MDYEELYPIFAVGYGTFGLLFGIFLWWRTQRRIERTSQAISAQVKAAIGDINGRVDEGMSGVEDRLGIALEAQKGTFSAITIPTPDDIASAVEDALNEKLDAFSASLGPMMSNHIGMALKQAEAQQSKRVGQFLQSAGLDEQLEGMSEAAKEQALAMAGPGAQFVAEIMSAKIPKNATLAEKAWLQICKAAAVQMAQSGMMGIQLPGQVAQATAPASLSPYGP